MKSKKFILSMVSVSLIATSFLQAHAVDDTGLSPSLIDKPKIKLPIVDKSSSSGTSDNSDLFPIDLNPENPATGNSGTGGNNNPNNGNSGNNNGKKGSNPAPVKPAVIPVKTNEKLPGMTAIETSLAKDAASCPLVDGRPRQDLIKAAENLAGSINLLKECKNNAEVESMQGMMNSIIQSGKNLKATVADAQAASDPAKMTALQSDVSNVINGIDQVSRTFMGNTLINSDCGRQMMTAGGLLLGLSDLIQSVTPFAMAAVQANPAFAPAIPYIIGVAGVGNMVKVIKQIHDKNTINLDESKNRLAVLQGVCEYSRIVQRANSFKKAKSGQLQEATENMNKFNSVRQQIFSKANSRAQQLMSFSNRLSSDLGVAQKSADNDAREIRSLLEQIGGETADKTLSCYISRELVSRAGDDEQLPTRAIKNIQALISKQERMTITQAALLKAEAAIRKQIIAGQDRVDAKSISNCAQLGQSYVEALSRLVDGTKVTIKSLNVSLDETLSADIEVKTLKTQVSNLETEVNKIIALTKSASILRYMGRDNGVLDDSEIDIKLAEIKRALFGSRSGVIGGDSPALAWLNKIDEQMRLSEGQFEKEADSLRHQLFSLHTKTGRSEFITKDKQGRNIRMTNLEIDRQIIADLEATKNLGLLTIKLVPEGSESHRNVCRRLENIWFQWYATMNHLASQELFCASIKDYVDTSFQPGLKKRCVGYQDLAGKSYVRSGLDSTREELSKRGRDMALNINKKMFELNCAAVGQ